MEVKVQNFMEKKPLFANYSSKNRSVQEKTIQQIEFFFKKNVDMIIIN